MPHVAAIMVPVTVQSCDAFQTLQLVISDKIEYFKAAQCCASIMCCTGKGATSK